MSLSRIQMKVLRTLDEAGEPLFNGTLAARTGLRWNSGVFSSLERMGLIESHPFKLTDEGRAALSRPEGKIVMVTQQNSAMYIDRFTSLDDIKGADRSNDWLVLRTIMEHGGRFSVFDANSDAMAHTLTRICQSDWVKRKDDGFPWTVLELTDAGRLALAPAQRGTP